mmetsp:Transcript_1729/g.4394  ORF Transcript_1729/g.4394 Transcript_1729/m.4394 type:complete len:252 (+) Transcript_1729:254-1009(+)
MCFRIRMRCGTGSSPTSVPFCRNSRISASSVTPLSAHSFSTCGTSTCSSRWIGSRSSLVRQLSSHSRVGLNAGGPAAAAGAAGLAAPPAPPSAAATEKCSVASFLASDDRMTDLVSECGPCRDGTGVSGSKTTWGGAALAVSPSSANGDDTMPISRVKILRRRMMTYARCWFPSNWYWIRLLNVSMRKKMRRWLFSPAKRYRGDEKVSKRCTSLLAPTSDTALRYGDTFTMMVCRHSYSGASSGFLVTSNS